MTKGQKIKVKLMHSGIASLPKHRATLKGLGLSRPLQERILPDTPQVRGMVAKVCHLVKIVEEKENNPQISQITQKKT